MTSMTRKELESMLRAFSICVVSTFSKDGLTAEEQYSVIENAEKMIVDKLMSHSHGTALMPSNN